MDFVSAVRLTTLGYRMRRPWRNNKHKHVFYDMSTHTLRFSHVGIFTHDEVYDNEGECTGLRDLSQNFKPTVPDIMANDWYIAKGLEPSEEDDDYDANFRSLSGG